MPVPPALTDLLRQVPELEAIRAGRPTAWVNPHLVPAAQGLSAAPLAQADIDDAAARLDRFAPLIAKQFPETQATGGIIESPLVPADHMGALLGAPGRLLLKQDSHLAIAGSVKARGGIYEVLKHAEDLALAAGIIDLNTPYDQLLEPPARAFFAQHSVQVGSTGNLGMSIGIASAALGFKAVVHMSADAKQWKKDLLRSHGVDVREYAGDYGAAVRAGRALSHQDPLSYFVDDENSRDLFMGYAVAARRLVPQLEALGVSVSADHPLAVYVPCGVGGAPGGISFGLKQVFGDAVHCFFVEPTQAPCMLLGMATGLHSNLCVQDAGLSGITQADGLAVGRPSGFVGSAMKPFLSGILTVDDSELPRYLCMLYHSEGIFVEPSAAAAFAGPERLFSEEATRSYAEEHHLDRATHIAWATGGALVPPAMREHYLAGAW